MGRRPELDCPAPETLDEAACVEELTFLRGATRRIREDIERFHQREAAGEATDPNWLPRAHAALRHKTRAMYQIELRLLHLLLATGGEDELSRFAAAATATLDPEALARVWTFVR